MNSFINWLVPDTHTPVHPPTHRIHTHTHTLGNGVPPNDQWNFITLQISSFGICCHYVHEWSCFRSWNTECQKDRQCSFLTLITACYQFGGPIEWLLRSYFVTRPIFRNCTHSIGRWNYKFILVKTDIWYFGARRIEIWFIPPSLSHIYQRVLIID